MTLFRPPSDPGPPPRRLTLPETFGHFPVRLQVGAVGTSLALGICLAGFAWDPATAIDWAGYPLCLGLLAMTWLIVWALRLRRILVHGQVVQGEVVRVVRGEGPFATSAEVRYAYEVDGRRYRDTFLAADGSLAFKLAGGVPITLLVDPRAPSLSTPWEIPTPRRLLAGDDRDG